MKSKTILIKLMFLIWIINNTSYVKLKNRIIQIRTKHVMYNSEHPLIDNIIN